MGTVVHMDAYRKGKSGREREKRPRRAAQHPGLEGVDPILCRDIIHTIETELRRSGAFAGLQWILNPGVYTALFEHIPSREHRLEMIALGFRRYAHTRWEQAAQGFAFAFKECIYRSLSRIEDPTRALFLLDIAARIPPRQEIKDSLRPYQFCARARGTVFFFRYQQILRHHSPP